MKKRIISIFCFIIIFVYPLSALAEESQHVPMMVYLAKGLYKYTTESIKEIENEPKGSYLPGVYDRNTPSFALLSQNASNQIKKKKEEELAKKKAKQQQLGAAEAALEGKYIDIDLSTQTLTAFDNKAAVYRFKVSSGKSSMPTPVGTFKILNKTPRAYSSKYGLYMPYWMAFRGDGYGIHELPEWPGGYKEGANHLGIPVSHGCVRLGVGAAGTIYTWANAGDTVYIHK